MHDASSGRLILTNVGHRLARHIAIDDGARAALDPQISEPLLALWADLAAPPTERAAHAALIDAGLVQPDSPLDDEAVRLRYARNPLQHVERLVFEFTTRCDFSCVHCRNRHVAAETETDLAALKRAADLAMWIGVRKFDFIGGEVTRHGDGWLEVVRHLRDHPAGKLVGVVTNGWFLGQRDFVAAGERYADHRALLQDFRTSGLTHVVFSLDGPQPVHDRWRSSPGLYRRILAGVGDVERAGLLPRVSVVIGPHVEQQACLAWLETLVDRIYQPPPGTPREDKLALLLADETNYVSRLIDIGAGARPQRGRYGIDDVPDELLRCKAYFRPHPSLRIQASGELSVCPLIDAGVGYGNVRRQGLAEVLNRMQQAFVYRLHAEGRVGHFRRLVDRELFGERFDTVCTLRAVITLIAREMFDQGIDASDAAAIRRINRAVARRAGFLSPGSPK